MPVQPQARWDGGLTIGWTQVRPNGCTKSKIKKTVKPCGKESSTNPKITHHNETFNVSFVDE